MDKPMIMAIHWKAQECDPYRRFAPSCNLTTELNWTELKGFVNYTWAWGPMDKPMIMTIHWKA